MALSVGIGDCIALAGVLKSIVAALKDGGGAGEQHESLTRELVGLERILRLTADLRWDGDLDAEERLLNMFVADCRTAITQFESRTKKCRRRLMGHGPIAWWSKVDWAVMKRDTIQEFRKVISGHRANIYGTLAVIRSKQDASSTARQHGYQQSVQAQTKIVKLCFEFFMRKLVLVADSVSALGQQGLIALALLVTICQKLHDLQASLNISTRLLGHSNHVTFLDATGRIWPLYLEAVWSKEALIGLLKGNFKDIPGAIRKLDNGEFVIEDRDTKRDIDLNRPWISCFAPGQSVAMSIAFYRESQPQAQCPRCAKYAANGHVCTDEICTENAQVRIMHATDRKEQVLQGPEVPQTVLEDEISMWRRIRILSFEPAARPPSKIHSDMTFARSNVDIDIAD